MNAKDDSRQKILQAAFEAFAENGFERTTMDDIVRRSGLSKGTIYWHFKNKNDLFVAIMHMVFEDMARQLAYLVSEDRLAAERIRAFFHEAAMFLEKNKNLIGLLINAFFQSYQSEEPRQVMLKYYEQYIQTIAQIIQQGIDRGEFRAVDPRMAAIALMAGGDGVALYSLLDPSWTFEDALNALVDLTLHGMKKESSDQ
jgi:AcrR family transcriptional regulator